MVFKKQSAKSKVKQPETIRERAEQAKAELSKNASKSKVSDQSTKKRGLLRRKSTKPRRFHIIPKFFRESVQVIREVTWPSWRNAAKLTFAVIMFSVVFSALVDVLDLGLVRVFKKVLLHGWEIQFNTAMVRYSYL